jgi:hypothetical protein
MLVSAVDYHLSTILLCYNLSLYRPVYAAIKRSLPALLVWA